MSTTFSKVHKYRDLGWKCFPVHGIDDDGSCTCGKGPDCSRPGKHPSTVNGFKDASLDAPTLRRWFKADQPMNVAIATGTMSCLVILDIDPRNGGRETIATAQERLGDLPRTLKVKTGGGGYHLYFRHPKGCKIPKDSAGKRIGPGVDVLSDGAYAVAPPSCHASGNHYRWVKDRSIDDGDLADLPPAWIDVLSASAAPAATVQPGQLGCILEGQRNSTLASEAGRLVNLGLDLVAITGALKAINLDRCTPPLPDDEVDSIAQSIATRYRTGERPDRVEKVAQATLDRHFRGGSDLIYAVNGSFDSYRNGRWATLDETILRKKIIETIRALPGTGNGTDALAKQVVSLLQALQSHEDDVLRIGTPQPPVVNCKNCELWLTRALKAHSYA